MIAVADDLRTSQARVRALEAKLAEAVQLLRYAGEIMDEYQSLWKEAQLIPAQPIILLPSVVVH